MRVPSHPTRLVTAPPAQAPRRHSSFIVPTSSFLRRSAFTLVELLVVISLIVLILAMAVPAFNFITGGRSIEAGRNKISAMLSRARNEAIARGGHVGVVFFRDNAQNAVGMQLVQLADLQASNAQSYQAWTPGVAYRTTSGDRAADRVYALVWDGTEGPNIPPPTGKYVVRTYDCLRDHTSTSGLPGGTNSPPLNGVIDDVTSCWGIVPPGTTQSLDAGIEYLPIGVGCQLVHDQQGNTNTDRYVQTGVIAFDEQGKLLNTSWTITGTSSIGALIQLTGKLTGQTEVGVMLYEQEQMLSQAGATTGDNCYNVPSLTPPANSYANGSDEYNEEAWLDQNALHLLVERYTGNLLKVE